jgi:hypothetical protein
MTETTENGPFEGGCTCRDVRYQMESPPIFVHCCHCTWCQRETGAAFALNAMIEAQRVTVLEGTPEVIEIPSLSGGGQSITRCPQCKIALWSYYGSGAMTRLVRVGTLDRPARFPPDVHIFTESKQPWVMLSDAVPAFPQFYSRQKLWPKESLERIAALKAAAAT